MRPLPTVDPLVRVEAGGRGERLAAVVAGERPVPSVSPAQICVCKVRVKKGHTTGGDLPRVSRQQGRTVEHFPTKGARK